MQWEKSQTAGKERKGTRWRTKRTVCARVCGRGGGGRGQMAHGRRDDTRTLLRSRFRSKLSCLRAHVWPAADLSSSYRRFEFLPERKPSLVHDQRSALSAEGGEEEDRELGLWAEVGSRGCSRGWVHLVARHDYATAIDLLVPIVETSCSPRCRIKSWMSLPTGTIWSRGMADFTISCLV